MTVALFSQPTLHDFSELCNLTLLNIFHTNHTIMFDGFPGNLPNQRLKGNRNKGHHEEWEGKHVKNLLCRGGVDILPLGYSGNGTDDKEDGISGKKGLSDGNQNGKDRSSVHQSVYTAGNINGTAKERNYDCGKDIHNGVIAGKTVLPGLSGENAAEQAESVLFQNLQITSGPAKTLSPGLMEIGRLLIKELSFPAETNTVTVADYPCGKLKILG